ncbi:MAG: hypothetical protein ABIH41_00270, partial [Nanoarchaeota archaeon]
SSAKYWLFLLLFVGMAGGEYILTHNDVPSTTPVGFQVRDVRVAAEQVSERSIFAPQRGSGTYAFSLPSVLVVGVVIFLLLGGYFAYQQRPVWSRVSILSWKVQWDDLQPFVGLMLRLVAAVPVLLGALAFSSMYGVALLLMIGAVVLVVGVLTRWLATFAAVYYVALMIAGRDPVLNAVLLVVSLCILVLGGGKYSLDHGFRA